MTCSTYIRIIRPNASKSIHNVYEQEENPLMNNQSITMEFDTGILGCNPEADWVIKCDEKLLTRRSPRPLLLASAVYECYDEHSTIIACFIVGVEHYKNMEERLVDALLTHPI